MAEQVQPLAITIDDALSTSIGDFGRHQRWIFSLISLPWLPGAFLTLSMTFTGKDPVLLRLWTCVDLTDEVCRAAYNAADPSVAFCKLAPAQWAWTAPRESVISDFALQCGGEWKVQLANSGYFLGFLFGASLWGVLSDRWGRKPTMMASCVTSALCAALTAASPNYWVYAALRTVTGLTTSGIGLVSFVLATEIVGPSARGVAAIATQLFWAAGECLLPLVAYCVSAWRSLTLASSALTLCLLLLWPLIPESPRWLLTQGRAIESWSALKRFADGNGTSMPANAALAAAPPSAAAASLWDTFRMPVLRRRQIILLYCWCVVSLGFYGVSMALESLGGSLYLNFFLISVIEFPSYFIAIWLVDVAGRKPLTVYNFAICGVACFLCALLPSGVARTAFAVVGKFGAAIAFIILFLYTTELFPTVVRNAALGSNSSAARVGGMLAPVVVLLAKELHALQLPFIVFGVVSIVAAFVSSLLPETMNQPLMETFEDVERESSSAHMRPHRSGEELDLTASNAGDAELVRPTDGLEATSAPRPGFLSRLRALQGWAKLDGQRAS